MPVCVFSRGFGGKQMTVPGDRDELLGSKSIGRSRALGPLWQGIQKQQEKLF